MDNGLEMRVKNWPAGLWEAVLVVADNYVTVLRLGDVSNLAID